MIELSRNKRIKLIIAIIIIVIFLSGLIYATYNMITWKKDVDKNNKLKKEISEKIKKENNKYNINFEALKSQNSDTIAFIKVKGTNINYVVVKNSNNTFYLKHDFNKEYNIAGWIYADYKNKFDGTDDNIVIYGHNTSDGSMFGTLKDTLDKEWQSNKDNYEIDLVTEEKEYKYQVFSTYEITPEDYYIKTNFNDDDEYIKFLKKLKSRSNYDYKVKLKRTDQILTLSSCNINGNKRIVLHAKLIEDED